MARKLPFASRTIRPKPAGLGLVAVPNRQAGRAAAPFALEADDAAQEGGEPELDDDLPLELVHSPPMPRRE